MCDCYEEIAGGKSFYLMTYSDDGSTQSPLCYKCATEAMEGEVIEATRTMRVTWRWRKSSPTR